MAKMKSGSQWSNRGEGNVIEYPKVKVANQTESQKWANRYQSKMKAVAKKQAGSYTNIFYIYFKNGCFA